MASDLINSLGVDPSLSRMASADAAMVRAKAGLTQAKKDQIDGAAKDFEAMFISQMLGAMFDSVPTDPEFGGGEAEDTWKGLMIDEYGKQIVKAGGIGISDDIKAKMIEMQGEKQ
jgi:Rod binding domain-containing protein